MKNYKSTTKEVDPLDKVLELIKTMPRINWREAWEEVKTERNCDILLSGESDYNILVKNKYLKKESW